MEETKTTNIKKASLNCMNGKCTRIRKQYCKDHDMIVCSKCYTALHVKCCCEEIISINDVKDCIDLVKNLLNSITDNNKKFRISCYTKDFDSEIKSFAESLASIDNKLSEAIEKDAFIQYKPILNDLIKLQRSLVDSNSLIEYSKILVLQSAAMGTEDSSSNPTLVPPSAGENVIKKIQEKLAEEIEKNKMAELKEVEEEMKKRLIEENKERITQLEATITQLNDKNTDLTAEIKKQVDEFENKIKVLEITYKEEKFMLKEKFEQDQSQISYIKDLMEFAVFQDIEHVVFNFDESVDSSIIHKIILKKIRLPNLADLTINNIGIENKQFINFLEDCCPKKPESLHINTENKNKEGIKLRYSDLKGWQAHINI